MPRARRHGKRAFGPGALALELGRLLPGYPELEVCVAFSGGVDSTALLAALARLPRPPLGLRALHVDHGLHPDSPRWAAHCRRVARSLGVPLKVCRTQVRRARGESLEASARTARYALLGGALGAGEALLSAHHQDDQLETVLLQLLRGAGLAGLAAMPARAPLGRGSLVRPLLAWSREELTGWVRSQGLAWIEDPSNSEPRLDRSYLRTRVLPLLRARWPAAAATAARTARHAAEAQRLLEALGAADAARAASGAKLSAKLLRALPLERRRNALRFWISARGHRPPPASRLEEIAGPLLEARTDAKPAVAWGGACIERHADLLSLEAASAGRAGPGAASAPRAWRWRREGVCALPARGGELVLRRDARGNLDLDALPATLTVRRRGGGERLRPVRGGPRRTLKGLLQQARVPPAERARLPLLFAGERLIAVADRWLDESVQASAACRHRARLKWHAPP